LGGGEDQNAARRTAYRYTVADDRRSAGIWSRCLFVCDATNLVGVAALRNFQFARVQPADPRGLPVVCAKSALRLACLQVVAALIEAKVRVGRDTGDTREAALQRTSRRASSALELGYFGALRLPDPDFMPVFKGVPYWKPHKICINCYFSTARCVTMRWIQANL